MCGLVGAAVGSRAPKNTGQLCCAHPRFTDSIVQVYRPVTGSGGPSAHVAMSNKGSASAAVLRWPADGAGAAPPSGRVRSIAGYLKFNYMVGIFNAPATRERAQHSCGAGAATCRHARHYRAVNGVSSRRKWLSKAFNASNGLIFSRCNQRVARAMIRGPERNSMLGCPALLK